MNDRIDDSIYPAVRQYVEQGGKPLSKANVQRVFKLGYNRTVHLFERLHADGVIEPVSEAYGVISYQRVRTSRDSQ